MEIRIKVANPRLTDQLYEIEKKCFANEAFSKQQLRILLSSYNSEKLVASVDNNLIGFIIGRIELSDRKLVGHIMTIDVLPAYRRIGIAEKLMMEMEDIFRRKGSVESRLEVRKGNVAAIRLYEKLGYENVALLENYYGKMHGYYLRKVFR